MTATFVNQREFQSYVLNFISSEKYKEILKNMINGDKEDFQQGFVQGLCWGSLLTSQVHNYYADIPEAQKEEVVNDSNTEVGTGTENSSSET